MTFIRKQITNAWLDIEGTIIPVGSLTVSFALNTLPTANVVPALGRELTTGQIATIRNSRTDQKASLYFTFNGETRLLLSGVVNDIVASDNATMFNRRVSAVITIVHRAIQLAGSPALSYVFTADTKASLAILSNINSRTNPLTGEEYRGFSLPWLKFKDTGGEVKRTSTFLKNITEIVIKSNNREPLPDDLIKDYNPANLLNIQFLVDINMYKEVAAKFSQAWEERNTFEALVATCNMLFLSLVFYNDGFYIANTNSLINTPSVEIRSDEYISITGSETRRTGTEVEGIILRHPFGGLPLDDKKGVLTVYPPVKEDAIGGGVRDGILEEFRYYHQVDIPSWLRNSARNQWRTTGKVPVVNRGKVKGAVLKDPLPESLPEYYTRIGPRVARAIYAQMRARQTGVILELPYREDLMPGTAVSIKNADTLDIQFLGTTLFGMISAFEIQLDVFADDPSLVCKATIADVRSEVDNQEPPVGFGLNEEPLYQSRWVGTDLFGNLLEDIPDDTNTPPPTDVPVNNANSGGAAGRP